MPRKDQTKLSDKEIADVYVAYAETGSYREVAKRFGIAASTVSRVLNRQDPIRFQAIVKAHADARAEKWRALESRSLDLADDVLKKLTKSVELAFSNRKGKLSHERRLELGPRLLSAAQRMAADATKNTQLLTGGVTERLGEDPDAIPDLTDEQLIALAEERGIEPPPGVRDRQKRGARDAR